MRLPNLSQSANTLSKEPGLYHLARLRADPNFSDMADSWSKAQDGLASRWADYEKARGEAMVRLAARDGAAAELQAELRAFYGTLVTKTHNNRRSPLFAVYFPDNLTAVTRAPLETEVQRVSVIVGKLGQEGDKDLVAHAGPLTTARDMLLQALDAHRVAVRAESEAFGLAEQEKVAWLDAYKHDQRVLAQIFYKEPQRAESYFKPARKGKAAAAPATVPAVHLAETKEATA